MESHRMTTMPAAALTRTSAPFLLILSMLSSSAAGVDYYFNFGANRDAADVIATTESTGPDPDFMGPIPNISVPIGKEAILPCHVTNLGQFKVGWIQADTQTILTLHKRVITHNPRIWVTSDEEDRVWKLHIRRVKISDKGCYMCQINTSHMKKQSGCIDVNVPPDILSNETSSDTTVQEGHDVRLVCRAQGHPKPKIVWRREDGKPLILRRGGEPVFGKQYEGEELKLFKVKRRQAGAYLCIAKNAVPPSVSKRIILNVNFKPEIKPVEQMLLARTATNVTIGCHLEAYPNTINYWLRNSTEILLNGSKYVITEEKVSYETTMRLTINNFRFDDAGSYSCRTGNSLGDVQANIMVDAAREPAYRRKNKQPERKHMSTSSSSSSATSSTSSVGSTQSRPMEVTAGDDEGEEESSSSGTTSSHRCYQWFSPVFMQFAMQKEQALARILDDSSISTSEQRISSAIPSRKEDTSGDSSSTKCRKIECRFLPY